MKYYVAGFAATALMLTACATSIPLQIKQAPPDNPGLQQVLDDPDAWQSRQARWGGTILETENREDMTRLLILARPLSKDGEPRSGDTSLGRFIAVIPRFLDPAVYSKDREVTITGTIQGVETRKVGEFPYRYPVVLAEHHYVWPQPDPYDPYRYPRWWHDPWYYDPWYFPYYPYHHPYWR
ncbi:MAG: Slp family lipoprotein [Thiogranum sp.]|nr:Slp family lipoprotein [Thiogranum sp.]